MTRKNVETVQIYVPEGAREIIKQYAEGAGYAVLTDYIRALIEADMKAHGADINLSVDRGGNRRSKKQEDEE